VGKDFKVAVEQSILDKSAIPLEILKSRPSPLSDEEE